MSRTPPKNDNVLDGLPIATDPRSLINYGQMATNVMGKFGNPAAAGLEYIGAGYERDDNIREAAALAGEDARSLSAGSPAFKKYVKELGLLEEERMSGFVVGLIGGGIATALVGSIFGLPGGIMGFIVGSGVAMAGAMLANLVREQFWPSQGNEFLTFANNLQSLGEQRQMIPEAAFIALTMNLPDDRYKREILHSLPRQFKVTRARDMMKLLGSEEGREALREAMVQHDATLRAANSALSQYPAATLSEHLAAAVNNGSLAGVDLLSAEKTGMLGPMIVLQEMQQANAQAAMMQPPVNPNTGLPQQSSQMSRA